MPKKGRLTIIELEKEAARKKQMEAETKKKAEERRRQTLKVCIYFKEVSWLISFIKFFEVFCSS